MISEKNRSKFEFFFNLKAVKDILEYFFNLTIVKAILIIVIIIILAFILNSISSTIPSFANLVLSFIATATALVAINQPTIDKQINSIEYSLYNFYYPLQDYIEGYSILGIEQDKKEIEKIGHYRRLAKEETRIKFESYRNGNYRKEDGINLLPCVIADISHYENRLKKIRK